jgi:two-component system, chemotaxis family, chemotaxis protein CheY
VRHECLILDDSRMVRAIARRSLESFGLSVIEAETAEDAFAQCQRRMPAMVLVDWNLPGMSGPDFIRAVRGRATITQPHLLLSSTENCPHRIAEAMKSGADAYLAKPYERAELGRKLVEFGIMAG